MSIQAGIWNLDGAPVDRLAFESLSRSLAQWAPDGVTHHWGNNCALTYRPFYTNRESRSEEQPYKTRTGCIVTWDGRLDNREMLLEETGLEVDRHKTDVSIVAALWDRHGTAMFPRLLGDFACAIWSPDAKELYLARDFAGVRTIYYALQKKRVVWSTHLDPLSFYLASLIPGIRLTPCDRWIAGYLAWLPEPHLTPVSEIVAVPPAHWVRIRSDGKESEYEYWRFRSATKIRYKTDADYEAHYRDLFSQAVRRRMRSDSPIVVELSGGIDSSCIACVGNELLRCPAPTAPGLATVSFYTETNPLGDHLDEIERIERWIGRTGTKVSTDGLSQELAIEDETSNTILPHLCTRSGIDFRLRWNEAIASTGGRVVLSGEGGDELTGAHQSPTPLIAQQLVTFHWIKMASIAFAWSTKKKVRIGYTLLRALRYALRNDERRHIKGIGQWLTPEFVERTDYVRLQSASYPHRFLMPEHQRFCDLFEGVRRIISCRESRWEYAYPFVDRDLCEFSFAIPFEQLLRPTERRSLLRRSMHHLVPVETIDQRGKRRGVVRHPSLDALLDDERISGALKNLDRTHLGGIFADTLAWELASTTSRRDPITASGIVKIFSLIRWQRALETIPNSTMCSIQSERR